MIHITKMSNTSITVIYHAMSLYCTVHIETGLLTIWISMFIKIDKLEWWRPIPKH